MITKETFYQHIWVNYLVLLSALYLALNVLDCLDCIDWDHSQTILLPTLTCENELADVKLKYRRCV